MRGSQGAPHWLTSGLSWLAPSMGYESPTPSVAWFCSKICGSAAQTYKKIDCGIEIFPIYYVIHLNYIMTVFLVIGRGPLESRYGNFLTTPGGRNGRGSSLQRPKKLGGWTSQGWLPPIYPSQNSLEVERWEGGSGGARGSILLHSYTRV